MKCFKTLLRRLHNLKSKELCNIYININSAKTCPDIETYVNKLNLRKLSQQYFFK